MPAQFLRRVAARASSMPDDRGAGTAHGATALALSLHLTLHASDVASTDSLGVLMQFVIAEHRRLRELHVVASSQDALAALVDAVGRLAMPNLDTLRIIFRPMANSKKPKKHPLLVAFDIFDGRAPSLRRVELRECGLPVSGAARLSSLREFSLVVGPFTSDDLDTFAIAAPSLTHLTLVGQCQSVVHDGLPSSSLQFPALQSLRLCGATNLPSLLQHLDAPGLWQMQIEDWRIDDVGMLDQCISSITSSTTLGPTKFPRLRWLGLEVHAVWNTAPSIALERLSRIVVAFSALEHLTFSGSQVSAFLHELSLQHNVLPSSNPLPRLQSISLFGAHDRAFMREVAALVEKRMVAGCALREVGLSVLVTMSGHILPLALCRILKMYSCGTNVRGVIYPDDGIWMHSTYEREERLTTEYLHYRGGLR